ncbi:protein dj-1 homolog b [Phtheirospermum japonicum]|uniref:Protein dj-1 homolog b n=1 Tax=Phtheirospermum japonicum TaxID=374723 RepID=A0A830B1V2_9LAMI|nr:protein dj-1 homolog b [Phtheirospermum japonicum]
MAALPLRHLTPLTLYLSPLTRRPLHFSYSHKLPISRRNHHRLSTSSIMASAAKKVLVPIANGTEPLEAVITIDVLRRAGADVTVASVEKQLCVDACHGVKIVADALISDCADTTFDLISLPGGMPGATTLKDCTTLESMVKKQAADDRPYAAICAAPAVALGSWGLLKGLKATCYPTFMGQLSSSSASSVESRVQQDGKVVTSRGPGTAMEYSVALIELLYGKEKADEVSGPLVMRSNHGDEYTFTELNQVKWTFDSSPQILVPIANGTEEMEAVIIIDVLRRAKAEVVVASVEDRLEILASRNVKLVADVLLDEAINRSYDLIVLPGKKATAFPAMCNKLSDPSEAESRVVVDGNLVTSRGPGTTMEFSLVIAEKFFGREKVVELAKTMLFVL